jgi:hypothetical protein
MFFRAHTSVESVRMPRADQPLFIENHKILAVMSFLVVCFWVMKNSGDHQERPIGEIGMISDDSVSI